MRARVIAPAVPVPHEQPIVDARASLVLCPRIEPLPRAAERRAVRQHLHRDRQQLAERRHPERSDVERKVGHAPCLGSREHQAPHLLTPRARREEVQRATVGRPARARIATARVGELLRAGARGERQQPERGTRPVGGQVGVALHESDIAPVGRYLRVADAPEHHQVFGPERRSAGGGVRRARARHGQGTQAHGQRRPSAEVATHAFSFSRLSRLRRRRSSRVPASRPATTPAAARLRARSPCTSARPARYAPRRC